MVGKMARERGRDGTETRAKRIGDEETATRGEGQTETDGDARESAAEAVRGMDGPARVTIGGTVGGTLGTVHSVNALPFSIRDVARTRLIARDA